MTLQVHPIALGCMLVVAVGTLIYTYVTSRQQAQHHGYGGGSSTYDYDIPQASQTSSVVSRSEDSRPSSRRKKRNADHCSICLVDLKPSSMVKKLTCDHVFHAHCINVWLNTNKTCPNCRRAVNM